MTSSGHEVFMTRGVYRVTEPLLVTVTGKYFSILTTVDVTL